MTISKVKEILDKMLSAEEALLKETQNLQLALCYEDDTAPAPKHKKAEKSALSPEPVSEPKAEPEKTYTLESVRGILADKSTKGFQKEIKAILSEHGADKLSALSPDEYAAVVSEVEALSNA